MNVDPRHLRAVRRFEVERVLDLVPGPRGHLLEIGAADGFQAGLLARHFASVSAVDLAVAIPADTAFPVQAYDGHRLPFPDQAFDVVFSSNVLEHLAHVRAFQAEIRRVLKPGGLALHVLPSASWRLWTIFTHYLGLPGRLLARLRARGQGSAPPGAVTAEMAARPAGPARILLHALIEHRHGERGTTLGELYLFSRSAWRALFRDAGFAVKAAIPLGLFYTGYAVAGLGLDIDRRRRLARLLGSSTVLYVLVDARVPGNHAQAAERVAL